MVILDKPITSNFLSDFLYFYVIFKIISVLDSKKSYYAQAIRRFAITFGLWSFIF